MSSIIPNDDFLNDKSAINKPIDKPNEKPIPKMEVKPPAKKTKTKEEKKETTWKDVKVKSNPNISQNKTSEKTTTRKVVSQEQYDIEKSKYPEYFALSDYHKKCLITTNYWRVMNGMPIIEVPALYTYYYKYFDTRCYELAKEYQEKIKRIEQNKTNKEERTVTFNIQNKSSKNETVRIFGTITPEGVPETKIKIVAESEPIIPIKETKQKKETSKEKKEESVKPKTELTETVIDEIYKEAVNTFPSTMEKLVDDKKDDNEQLSLF